ncbi:hypothetical protein LINPERHAP1_LOCUS33979, partial [Linum perenne]
LLKSPSLQTASISPPVKLAIEESGIKQKNPNEIASIEQSAVLRQEGNCSARWLSRFTHCKHTNRQVAREGTV